MDVRTDQAIECRAPCSACGEELVLGPRPFLGEVVTCGRCRAQLEVADLEPVVLGPLAKIEEDEEDFDPPA